VSACTNFVDTVSIDCKNAGSQLEYTCTNWAAQGILSCAQWADEGSNQCTSWSKCHWYTPWNCIAGFFCRAWYWVASLVCIAFLIVTLYTCLVFGWVVVKVFCPALWLVMDGICLGWNLIWCGWLAIAAAISGLFAKSPGIARIDHVFVLMLENRAFDHMLGFSGITGVDLQGNPTAFNEGFTTSLSNVNPLNHVTVPVATPADYNLARARDASMQPTGDADPGHELNDTLVQLCGVGASYNPNVGYPPINNSGFIASYIDHQAKIPERIMRCFDLKQLPVLNQLAREFAICDQWFSSLPGPTWPNRLFAMAATSGGLDNSPDAVNSALLASINGFEFENGNIFDALDGKCIPWRIFAGDEFPVSGLLQGMDVNRLRGKITDFDLFASEINSAEFGENFIFIEPAYGAHKFDVAGPGDFTCGNSMHPLDDITRGEQLIKTVYESIRNSPHWERSLLIITFDEHGGFYDHVAPGPAVPPGDLETADYSEFGFKFDRLGVRVPALVISAHTPRGVIDHTVYDHTSILATVESLYGVHNLTQRDKAANTVGHLMSLPVARTDAPTSLNPPAKSDIPLPCEQDDETLQDLLMAQRAELRIAQRDRVYRDRAVETYSIPRTQYGFLAVALLRALDNTQYPERMQWMEDYRRIENGIDAALFMTEAKLKARYGLDMKKLSREGKEETRRRGSILERLKIG
jgi:phospholipase C